MLFNEDEGYKSMQSYFDHMNLNGGYAHLDTVEVKQDEVTVSTEEFPSKHFICIFIGLQAQKQIAPYAKFAFQMHVICLEFQRDVNLCYKSRFQWKKIFILAHGVVPREDEEN